MDSQPTRQPQPISQIQPNPRRADSYSENLPIPRSCAFCFDRGYIEFITYPDGTQVQLPPTQPSSMALHQLARQWAIEHGANPADPWGVNNKNAPHWPEFPVRSVMEVCECKRTDAIKSRLRRLLDSGEVPPIHHAHSFDTWRQLSNVHRSGKHEMLSACEDFAAASGHPTAGTKFSLVLSGPVGIGKTGLASCVLMERARRGQGVLWIDFNRFLYKVRDTYREGSTLTYDQLIGMASTVPFLLIDDLGDMAHNGDISDHTRNVLYDIISQRHDYLRETLITTNLTFEQMIEQFGNRIADRVKEMSYWLDIRGNSLRA